jgi:hypothetical protein
MAAEVPVALHVPPPAGSVNVIVNPWHTIPGPLMAAGNVFTVTVFVFTQPVLSV